MPEQAPVVSIVLATYNGSRYLAGAIQSCLDQTFRDWELILIDDGSSDPDVFKIIASFTDPRIRVLRYDTNRGQCLALNDGFAASRGAYLTWTSDDNLYDPEAVAEMVRALQADPSLDLVYAPYDMIDENGQVLRPGKVLPPETLERDNYIGMCFLYRRRVYETIGGYAQEVFLAADYDYWMRARAAGFRMKRLEKTVYRYRVHPGTITSRHGEDKMQAVVARIRRRYIPAWKHCFWEAERFYHAGQRSKALGYVVTAMVLNPIHQPLWRLLALLILPPFLLDRIRKQ